MKVVDILNVVANGLDASVAAISDPTGKAVAKGAAIVVRLAAEIAAGRSTEEAIAILEHIRDHGTLPISSAELDAQVKAAVDKAARE